MINSNKAWFSISFFFLCMIIFPLSYGNSDDVLGKNAISSIWICALFSNLISLESFFKGRLQEWYIIAVLY